MQAMLGSGLAGNGTGGDDETFSSSQCSDVPQYLLRALFLFIADRTRNGEQTLQNAGQDDFQFDANDTHYAAWVNGSAVCTLSKDDLRRLSRGPVRGPIRDPLYVVVPITCVYALIFLFGLVGNVSTCVVIARNRHMHTATNYYLFSLALSDLLLLVSGLPPEICHIWSRYPYLFGEVFCVLQGFAAETSANATVLTITAFTMERYVAICRPFRARAMSSLPRAVRCVLASWITALVLAVPPAMQFGIVSHRDELGRVLTECTVKRVLVKHAFLLSTGLVFVAPLAVISVLYVLIGLRLRRSRRALSARRHSVGSMGSIRANSTHSQARVIRMLVAVVVAFFICWAPFHAQRLLAVYASQSSQQEPSTVALYTALTYMSGVLYYLSTTVNPVLYHIMSNKFREAFKTTLRTECGWWSRRRDASRRQSYANLSGRAQTHCGSNCGSHSHCDSSALPPPPPAPQLPPPQQHGTPNSLTLTTTFDERSNTYSTVDERTAPSRPLSLHTDDEDVAVAVAVPPGALKGTRRALQRLRQQDNGHGHGHGHGCRAPHKSNGVASSRTKAGHSLHVPSRDVVGEPPGADVDAEHRPTTPPPAGPVVHSVVPPAVAVASAASRMASTRSPIEALARKLRDLPARSMRRHRASSTSMSGKCAMPGLRADHSAISNSSLQEWEADEQSGAELAELVQYMGELNQRVRL